MAAHSTCPSREQLAELVFGLLPQRAATHLEPHVAACPDCLATIQELHREDTLVDAVRVGANAPVDPEADLDEDLIATLCQLRPPTTRLTSPECTPDPDLPLPDPPAPLGQLGPYRLLRECGSGGMSVVFEAEDAALNRRVAVKTLRPNLNLCGQSRQRFLREARTAAAVRHDHIVTVFQVGEADGVPYLAMELLQGQTLEARLKSDEPLPLTEALRIGREVADGMAAAHAAGLIHRDIKPANLWLEAGTGRVKILDFGLARALADDGRLTQHGAIVGTPAYMAPEQARGEEGDGRCDLFSLGCVLYRLTTGRPAFAGKDVTSLLLSVALDVPPAPKGFNAPLPPPLAELILSLLSKSPDGRPASAAEVVARLAEVESDLQAGRKWPSPPRRRGLSRIAVGLCLVALVGALAWLPRRTHEEPIGEVSDPFAFLSPDRIDPIHLLALGNGTATPGLVAVLGDSRFRAWDEIRAVGYSPSGREVIAASRGKLLTWDAATGRLLHTRAGTYFSPDDKYLVHDATGWLHDARGNRLLEIGTFGHLTHGPAFLAEPPLLATTSGPRGLRWWNLRDGSTQRQEQAHRAVIHAMTFSPDGRRLASASADGVVNIWDVARGTQLHTVNAHPGSVDDLAFSPDGACLASCGYKTIKLWDAHNWTERRVLRTEGVVRKLVFRPDGKRLASAGQGGHEPMAIWDSDTGQCLRAFGGRESKIVALGFSADGQRLVSGGAGGCVRTWDVASGQETHPLRGHLGRVQTMRLTADGRHLITVGQDDTFRLWDLARLEEVEVRAGVLREAADSVRASADGRRFFVYDAYGRAKVFETVAAEPLPGRELFSLTEPTTPTPCLSDDGEYLATYADKRLSVWEVANGRRTATLTGTHAPLVLGFDPTGRQVTLAGADGVVQLWDWRAGRLTQTLRTDGTTFTALAYDPSGGRLAARQPEQVTVWDVASGQERFVRRLAGGTVLQLTFSPEGQRLAVVLTNATVKLLDSSTGKPLQEWTFPGTARCATFAPDGRHLLIGQANGTVGVLRLTTNP